MKAGDLVRVNHANLPACNAIILGTYLYWHLGEHVLALVVCAPEIGGNTTRILASCVELVSEAR